MADWCQIIRLDRMTGARTTVQLAVTLELIPCWWQVPPIGRRGWRGGVGVGVVFPATLLPAELVPLHRLSLMVTCRRSAVARMRPAFDVDHS